MSEAKPDYCYAVGDWEWTNNWEDRHLLTEDMRLGDIMQIGTLISGPDKWAAHVAITWDDDGCPDETEVRWFDTKEEAEAAIAAKPIEATP